MPIKVACKCGQSFAAPDNLAGRTVKCPKCGQPLAIPAPQAQQPAAPASSALADLFAEEGLAPKAGSGPQCPSCSSPMPPHGFICVQCGYNVQLGRRVQITDETKNSATRDAQQLLAKARKAIEESPQEFSAADLGAGANAYIAVVVILVSTAVLIGGSAAVLYFFGEEASVLAFIVGFFMYGVGRIWLIVAAFMDEISRGVFCLLCEFYCVYYALSRFRSVRIPGFMFLSGYVIVVFAQFALAA